MPEYERGFADDAALFHFAPQVVSLAGALSHAGKDGIAAVFGRDVVDQLLYQHRLSHAGAPEEADFPPLGVWAEQIDDLDARLQNLHRGALLAEGRGFPMDAPARAIRKGSSAVDRLAQHVEHPPQRAVAHRHFDAPAGRKNRHAAREPLAACEHDAARRLRVQMLRHFHDPPRSSGHDVKGVLNSGQTARKRRVDHRPRYPDNLSFRHFCNPFFFIALAPEVTSVISCVIIACRTR